MNPEGSTGIREQGLRQQMHIGNKRAFNKFFR
jgi:hypothetical protein